MLLTVILKVCSPTSRLSSQCQSSLNIKLTTLLLFTTKSEVRFYPLNKLMEIYSTYLINALIESFLFQTEVNQQCRSRTNVLKAIIHTYTCALNVISVPCNRKCSLTNWIFGRLINCLQCHCVNMFLKLIFGICWYQISNSVPMKAGHSSSDAMVLIGYNIAIFVERCLL